MEKIRENVVIESIRAEPLSDAVIGYLIARKKETPFLDYKKIIDVSKHGSFPEIAKDIFAFSNFGSGWILIGWEESKNKGYLPVGLPMEFKVDQATLQEKFNAFVKPEEKIELDYSEFEKDFSAEFENKEKEIKDKINSVSKRFGVIYIPPSRSKLVPVKEGQYKNAGREKTVFSPGQVFFRRGTQSIRDPTSYELKVLEKRLEEDNYQISVLSGEPDQIEETLYSNLFPISKFPKYVFCGELKKAEGNWMKEQLKSSGVFPEFYFKFKEWNNKLVTFENLFDEKNPYAELVKKETVTQESVENWRKDENKRRVIVELLRREFFHYAMGQGLFRSDRNSLFFPANQAGWERKMKWSGIYTASERNVAFRHQIAKLQRMVWVHVAFSPQFIELDNQFYLRILPTFIITDDGKKRLNDPAVGPVITSLSYDEHNSKYLHNILFWIDKLANNKSAIQLGEYLEISRSPIKTTVPVGLLFDIPTSELKQKTGKKI